MERNKFFSRVVTEGLSFYESPSPKNETFFYILFGIYVAFNFFLKIKWNDTVNVDYFRMGFVEIIMLGAAVYLVYAVADWKKLGERYLAILFVIGVALMSAAAYLSTKLSTNAFGLIFDLYFCLMVIGKDYKKILRNVMWTGIITLVFCYLGMLIGITIDVVKPNNNPEPGHSLGTVYPNTWGYIGFLIILIIWYLYLRRKGIKEIIVSFVLFWGAAAFMWFYICCHTIAVLAVVFPLVAVIIDLAEKRADKKAIEDIDREKAVKEKVRRQKVEARAAAKKANKSSKKEKTNAEEMMGIKVPEYSTIDSSKVPEALSPDHIFTKTNFITNLIHWIVTIIPFIAFGFVMYMSFHVEWIHKHFYYTKIHNLAMRFVQGGLYFKVYGIPLLGNPYDSRNFAYVEVNGEFLDVGILDSSYASYIIMRGLLWTLLVMLWLCIGNWKAIKKRDFAIPLIGAFILGFAMMERPGLELWYNFILLYPLAKVMNKPGTKSFEQIRLDNNMLVSKSRNGHKKKK